MQIADYCRQVETYLCQKNDGHLIRVVGPSFDLVAGWAARGVPLKIAFGGIDRCFERYRRKGPRRRPLKIDFCEADVLDVFDQWRQSVGLPAAIMDAESESDDEGRESGRRSRSLPAHLERVVRRLSAARADGSLAASFDPLIDAAARELEAARAGGHGLRGESRQTIIARLAALDVEFLRAAHGVIEDKTRTELMNEAESELAPFRARMMPEAFARARQAAVDRLLRAHFGLPVVAFL